MATAAPLDALVESDPVVLQPPTFALLPGPKVRSAIVSSFVLHLASLLALPFLLMLVPKPAVVAREQVEMISLRTPEPLPLNFLPRIASSGSSGGGAKGPAAQAKPKTEAGKSASAKAAAKPAETVYSGLVEIHSNLPHPTNRVQSIIRPDLVNAPKLKFPVRLPSMVVVPSPALPKFTAPAQKKNAETPPPPVPVLASELVEKPSLPVPANPPHVAGPEPEPSAKPAPPKPQPAAVALPDATISAKAALVVNAVEVSAPDAKVPDAEIAGNFSVVPAKRSGESDTNASSNAGTGTAPATAPAGASSGNASGPAAAANPGNAVGGLSGGTEGSKPGGNGEGGREPGNGRERAGSGSGGMPGNGAGSSPGAGAGAGKSSGSGTGNSPGISIMGGTGNSGRSRTQPSARPGYGITIVSGGSSGGASRDLGVFARNETVYTVYIPMTDAGGGADWSMQYAAVGPSAAGGGLLVPPLASKKIAAVCPGTSVGMPHEPIFVVAVIGEDGKPHDVRPVQRNDEFSAIAAQTLSKWEFLPAQVRNTAIAAKVVIGVVLQRAR